MSHQRSRPLDSPLPEKFPAMLHRCHRIRIALIRYPDVLSVEGQANRNRSSRENTKGGAVARPNLTNGIVPDVGYPDAAAIKGDNPRKLAGWKGSQGGAVAGAQFANRVVLEIGDPHIGTIEGGISGDIAHRKRANNVPSLARIFETEFGGPLTTHTFCPSKAMPLGEPPVAKVFTIFAPYQRMQSELVAVGQCGLPANRRRGRWSYARPGAYGRLSKDRRRKADQQNQKKLAGSHTDSFSHATDRREVFNPVEPLLDDAGVHPIAAAAKRRPDNQKSNIRRLIILSLSWLR